ncbi:glycosyltransferase 87 family protein [bacterium]|nr:glycosyltransferase 87 family protein [bacterium]
MSRAATLLAAAALAAVAILAPLKLASVDTTLISDSYGKANVPFELFGFFGALAVLAAASFSWRDRRPRTTADSLPILVPAALAFIYLPIFSEFSAPSFDFLCYQRAAAAVLDLRSPYGDCYLYPPLVAGALAGAYRALTPIAPALIGDADPQAVWSAVFYLYQVAQLALLVGAYFLLRRFAEMAGARETIACVLPAVLIVISNPVLRTIRHNQVNFWVIDLLLAGIVLIERRPRVAGFAIAAAAHIKLYPAIFIGLFAALKRGTFLAWSIVGLVAGLVGAASLAGTGRIWGAFFRHLAHFPPGRNLRDNSVHSLVANVYRHVSGAGDAAMASRAGVLAVIAYAISLAFVAWLAVRFVQRERRFRDRAGASNDAAASARRIAAHSADAIAAMLLVSPMVWEHHYVLALPIALYALIAVPRARLPLAALAVALMLAIPTFNVFPFSYHRLAGLVLFLVVTRPDDVGRAAGADVSASAAGPTRR